MTERLITELGNETTPTRGRWQYNENGQLTKYTWDNEDDGTPELTEISTYDADGHLIRWKEESSPWQSSSETYWYEDGVLAFSQHDAENDGVVDSQITYSYTQEGYLQQQAFDDNMDGVTDRTNTFQHDGEGRITVWEYNLEADGTWQTRGTTSYNEEGLPVQWTYEKAAGAYSKTTLFKYNQANQPIRATSSHSENTAKSQTQYAYNEAGLLDVIHRDDWTFTVIGDATAEPHVDSLGFVEQVLMPVRGGKCKDGMCTFSVESEYLDSVSTSIDTYTYLCAW